MRINFRSMIAKTVDDLHFNASAEAKICLDCTLPANKCKPLTCKRYKEERKKLKEVKK